MLFRLWLFRFLVLCTAIVMLLSAIMPWWSVRIDLEVVPPSGLSSFTVTLFQHGIPSATGSDYLARILPCLSGQAGLGLSGGKHCAYAVGSLIEKQNWQMAYWHGRSGVHTLCYSGDSENCHANRNIWSSSGGAYYPCQSEWRERLFKPAYRLLSGLCFRPGMSEPGFAARQNNRAT